VSGEGPTYNARGYPPLHRGRLRAGVPRLYCDAGTLPSPMYDADGAPVLKADGSHKWHANPSIRGLTWAWVLVDERDREVARDSGTIPCPIVADGATWPAKSDLAEFYAVSRGLRALPAGWRGEVATDNLLTIHRIWHCYPLRSLPPSLVRATAATTARLKRTGAVLVPIHLKGHPTRAMLALGHDGTVEVAGTPVSPWNDLADKMCNEERRKYEEALSGEQQASARATDGCSEAGGAAGAGDAAAG
jgi:hypothetical protein